MLLVNAQYIIMGYPEELEKIKELLEEASATCNFKYMLITKGTSPTTDVAFTYSTHFTH